MEIVTPENKAHWYTPGGESRHWTPYADKKRENEFRKTTLTDAKKHGYFPSVTTILEIISKPGLEAWKAEQAILSALTLPRAAEETEDGFAKRVVEDMKVQTREAAKRGTLIHNSVERYLTEKTVYLTDDMWKLFVPVRDWLEEEVEEYIMAERVLVHREEEYAGTVDLIAVLKSHGPCVCDFKTQGYKKEKPTFYPEWSLQLSAYAEAYRYERPRTDPMGILSIVIASDEPKPVQTHLWPAESMQERIEAFNHAHGLWRWARQYPRTNQPLEQF